MKVSVVLGTRDQAPILRDAIRSALAQSHTDLELLVSDDGSTDQTADVVHGIRDHRVSYLRRPHRGMAAARNAGLALARGDVVSFLDATDLWRPDKLEREVALLAAHPEAQAVFSDVEVLDGEHFLPSLAAATAVFSRRLPAPAEGTVLSQREMLLVLLEELPLCLSAFTIRRSAATGTGAFDEAWPSFSEWEFVLRVARRHRIGYVDRRLGVVRTSADAPARAQAAWGRAAMVRHLWLECARLREDSDARAAARRGVMRLCRHLGSSYQREGRRGAAALAFLKASLAARNPGLLLRAVGALA